MSQVLPFILCGGSGTRLWPLSREAFPKQFHKIAGDETLFQQACRRVTQGLAEKPIVLSGHKHRFLAAEQLEEIGLGGASIVLEPVARSTAPAACIAALIAAQRDAETVVLLAPADHIFADAKAFAQALETAIEAAQEGMLVVLRGEARLSPHRLRLYRGGAEQPRRIGRAALRGEAIAGGG